MAALGLYSVTKTYADGTKAVDRLSLNVSDGELCALLGPTGCGKSTVLRIIAGLEPVTSGEVHIGSQRVNDVLTRERHVAMVFQDLALYPHLSLRENLGFPLSLTKVSQASVERTVGEVAGMLGLGDLLDKWPQRLSGGEQQRVAMGRALIRRPEVFLMDEPLSNLDARLRAHLRTEIATAIRDLGTTTVYVTHDQAEAMSLGDRVAVMDGGVLHQIGTPAQVYHRPANTFVASFVGSPEMNLLEAACRAHHDGSVELHLGSKSLTFLPPLSRDQALLRGHDGRLVVVGVRPEALRVLPGGPGTDNPGTDNPGTEEPGDGQRWQTVHGTVRYVEFLGHATLVYLDTGSSPARVAGRTMSAPPAPRRLGLGRLRQRVGWHGRSRQQADRYGRFGKPATWEADEARVGDILAYLPATERPRIGSRVTLSMSLDRLYVFDSSGRRLIPV